jgi:hypothetical protein
MAWAAVIHSSAPRLLLGSSPAEALVNITSFPATSGFAASRIELLPPLANDAEDEDDEDEDSEGEGEVRDTAEKLYAGRFCSAAGIVMEEEDAAAEEGQRRLRTAITAMPKQIAAAAAMARIAETLSSLLIWPPAAGMSLSPSLLLPTIPPAEMLLRIMGSGMELLPPHVLLLFVPPPPMMHSPALPANASVALNLCSRSAGTCTSKEL